VPIIIFDIVKPLFSLRDDATVVLPR